MQNGARQSTLPRSPLEAVKAATKVQPAAIYWHPWSKGPTQPQYRGKISRSTLHVWGIYLSPMWSKTNAWWTRFLHLGQFLNLVPAASVTTFICLLWVLQIGMFLMETCIITKILYTSQYNLVAGRQLLDPFPLLALVRCLLTSQSFPHTLNQQVQRQSSSFVVCSLLDIIPGIKPVYLSHQSPIYIAVIIHTYL